MSVTRESRPRRLHLAILVAVMLSPGQSAAAELDESFAGMWVSPLGVNAMCHAVAPDGKIVLAGNSGDALLIARRLSNGAPDDTFGGDGDIIVTNPQYPMVAKSVVVQPDGKIVVAGYTNGASVDFLVVRLTAAGSLDPTFSGDGFAAFAISVGGQDYATKVLLQPDGKIVAVGSTIRIADWDFAAARLNANGTLDASFSGDGMVAVGVGGHDNAYDAVLQADGKLVMVGGTESTISADEDFAIVRLHVDGALDYNFGGDGVVTTGFGDVEPAYAVAIQPSDLRIVVAGRSHAARYYSSDGTLDGSFDGDGKLNLPITAYDAAVTLGGKITLIGIATTYARALRLNANGTLDTEWQTDGDVIVDSGVDYAEPPSLSFLADGRVLTFVPRGGDCSFRQYWANGSLDLGGMQSVAFDDVTFPPGSQEGVEDLAIQTDGRIVLAGQVTTAANNETDFALVRLLPSGLLDTSFGVRGRVALSLGNYDVAKAVAIQPDGKIVVAGYTGSGNSTNFMIARFNPNGSLDNTFGFGGFNALDFAGGADFGWALALVPDGRIVVAGTVYNGARNVYGVACFGSDGSLDHSFDVDGKQFFEFSVGPSHWCSAVVVQNGNRILVGGSVGPDVGVVALTLAGAVDVAWANTGRMIRDWGGTEYFEALALAPNGLIYGAGSRVIGGNADYALGRWSANGTLLWCPGCPNTWADQMAMVDYGATSGWLDAIHIRSDGHVVAVGTVGGTVRWAQFSPTSSIPEASGTAVFPGTASLGLAVRFAGTNQLLVAGSYSFQGDRSMAVARFETIGATVSVEEPALVAPGIRLHAPSPNPLVSRAMFAFDLPRAQTVSLAIHDAAGRRVRVLAQGNLAAGRHQQSWDGTDDRGRSVASGVYFARLDAGSEQARTSVIVLR